MIQSSRLFCLALLVALTGAPLTQSAAAPLAKPAVIDRYTDPAYQTSLPFGTRSHWVQPWRAYSDTWPVSRLQNSVGINLNVSASEADAVCAHLAKHGFRHARVEIGWGNLRWDDETHFTNQADIEKTIRACRDHHIRPLFLLNAHHGAPCPIRFFDVTLTRPAHRGDRQIQCDPSTLKQAVVGRSGLSQLTDYWAAESLFTAIQADGTVTLSRALPKDLPAGKAAAATLKYLPFYPAKLKADGSVPPAFAETMAGWLSYARAVAATAERVLGTGGKSDSGFDIEVWNELTFGSNFLSINRYYDTPVAEGEGAESEILARTVAWASSPESGLRHVGVGDGFDNQWPWGSGTKAPAGLAALDKHPYAGVRIFPKAQGEPNGIRPVNALGKPDGVSVGTDRWKDTFIPSYVSHFPEYSLNALQTEHIVRDISPIVTDLYGVPHGRSTHGTFPDGRPAPAPTMWITEVNMDPAGANPGDLADYTRGGHTPVAPGLTPADADRMKAKSILRYLSAFVNKGVERIYFFAVKDDNPLGLALVSPALFTALKSGGDLEADDARLSSPTVTAVGRLAAAAAVGASDAPPRALTLTRIEEPDPRLQFVGDPATSGQQPDPHPPLRNIDVFGFFPFQVNAHRWAVPVYVMTRNLAQLYRPNAPATDPTRFDMPDERFILTIRAKGPIPTGWQASLYDPLNGKTLPVTSKLLPDGSVRVSLPVTDSPRLLMLDAAGQ